MEATLLDENLNQVKEADATEASLVRKGLEKETVTGAIISNELLDEFDPVRHFPSESKCAERSTSEVRLN